jgi:hypothetical protein
MTRDDARSLILGRIRSDADAYARQAVHMVERWSLAERERSHSLSIRPMTQAEAAGARCSVGAETNFTGASP